MTRRPRILFGGFVHESHTFLEGRSTLANFRIRTGDQILSLQHDSSPAGGFLTVARQRQWEVVPTVLAVAEPSATIDDDAFEAIWQSFQRHAVAAWERGVDAIYFVLHGAGATTRYRDAEGEWLRRVRDLDGAARVPIFGVIDLHANFSTAMATHSDCLVGYRENPHTDAHETAMRAAELLTAALTRPDRPRQLVHDVPIMLPPTGTASSRDPMRALLAEARRLEQAHRDVLAISINAGFSFGDGPHVGLSFSLSTYGDRNDADQIFASLSEVAMRHAGDGDVRDETIDQVFAKLNRWRRQDDLTGLHVIVEPSDNIGGGGPGGGVTLLRRLHQDRFTGVGFAVWDPDAVAVLKTRQVGDHVSLSLGGKGSRLYDGPVELTCQLIHSGSGRFELNDKHSHLAAQTGDWFDMGDCAIVRCDGITILISSIATPPMDVGQWTHFGIDPAGFTILVVKAAVAHRAAYDGILRRQLWVQTPGPCTSDVRQLDYRHRRRPMLPFEPVWHQGRLFEPRPDAAGDDATGGLG